MFNPLGLWTMLFLSLKTSYQKRSGHHVAVVVAIEFASININNVWNAWTAHSGCTLEEGGGSMAGMPSRIIPWWSTRKFIAHQPKDKNAQIWKERRAGRLEEFVIEAQKMKSGSLTTYDVITAALLKVKVVPYHMAYWAIDWVKVHRRAGRSEVKQCLHQRKNVLETSQSKTQCSRCQERLL